MTRLSIGDTELNSEDVAMYVENDIVVLSERLRALESQSLPDDNLLQTYRDLIDSRHAVLDWLRKDPAKIAETAQ